MDLSSFPEVSLRVDTLRVSEAGKPVCQRARDVYMGTASEPQSFEKRGECDKAASSHGVSLRRIIYLTVLRTDSAMIARY